MLTRRGFLKLGAVVGAGLFLPRLSWDPAAAFAFYQSTGLEKFKQPLRGVGPGGITVAAPDLKLAPVTRALHYSINIQQFTDKLHPSLGSTTLWGYNPARALGVAGTPTPSHLGGIIVAAKGVPIQITFTNKLPPKHILPVDTSASFPDAAQRQNAATTHLHGGYVPWISDGGPMSWFDPNGNYGPSTQSAVGNIYKILNPNLQPGQAEYYYPNNQSARMLWYHDHAHDLTRLNAYAGIASAYIIRDLFEAALILKGLPLFVETGGREIPLVIQDKIFVGADIGTQDPTWVTQGLPTGAGSLWYPHVYEPDRWELHGTPPDPSVIPEMFGDTMLANGVVCPFAPVEPRRYRLRILNACQARFLNLQLYVDDGSVDGITLDPNTLAPTNAKGPDFLVIGTEGGFLPKPTLVPSNVPANITTSGDGSLIVRGSLVTAPAERWDVLVDFKGFEGKRIILYSDAPAPFPMGDPINDYFPGAPGNPTQPAPGFGPNTRQIMRFDVGTTVKKPADIPLKITPATNLADGNDPLLVPIGVTTPPPGVPVRQLTLNETFDAFGRLIQLLGANTLQPGGTFGQAYMEAATETPKAGDTEVWQIANLTGDTHPIHFHLVNVQIISRQPFDADSYSGTPAYTGPARPPEPTEAGWKETVRMNPGEVTTVIMKFKLPTVPFQVPLSLNPDLGVSGYEYVWHCHILEHEEHDMMRPLVVRP
jgi:spore coat protein A, manganese oxidase